jgi:hypothetical protein
MLGSFISSKCLYLHTFMLSNNAVGCISGFFIQVSQYVLI